MFELPEGYGLRGVLAREFRSAQGYSEAIGLEFLSAYLRLSAFIGGSNNNDLGAEHESDMDGFFRSWFVRTIGIGGCPELRAAGRAEAGIRTLSTGVQDHARARPDRKALHDGGDGVPEGGPGGTRGAARGRVHA